MSKATLDHPALVDLLGTLGACVRRACDQAGVTPENEDVARHLGEREKLPAYKLLWRVCVRVEDYSGIPWHDVEVAAFHLPTQFGLAKSGGLAEAYQPFPTDKMRALLRQFALLDQNGTTARIWQEVRHDVFNAMREVGFGQAVDREGKRKRIPRAEAEILVREYLAKHAKARPASVTRDAVAANTGVSGGMVSETAAWKAFRDRRSAQTKPAVREVPLTETMQAVVPADCAPPDELVALIEEQEKERAEEMRRHKRRHAPS